MYGIHSAPVVESLVQAALTSMGQVTTLSDFAVSPSSNALEWLSSLGRCKMCGRMAQTQVPVATARKPQSTALVMSSHADPLQWSELDYLCISATCDQRSLPANGTLQVGRNILKIWSLHMPDSWILKLGWASEDCSLCKWFAQYNRFTLRIFAIISISGLIHQLGI